MEHFAIAYGLHMDAALTSEATQMKTVLPGNHTVARALQPYHTPPPSWRSFGRLINAGGRASRLPSRLQTARRRRARKRDKNPRGR